MLKNLSEEFKLTKKRDINLYEKIYENFINEKEQLFS